MFPLLIRSASATDEKDVVTLWRACGLVTSYNDPTQDFHYARSKQNSDVLVGVGSDEQIVGSVMVGHDGHRGWLYYVAAAPDRRLRGIGRRMVKAGEQWLRERKVPKVMLLVRQTNTEVIDFYNRLGFEAIPRVVLQKRLGE